MGTPLSPFAANWRDAIRDVVLIVASILIAFGLDAWWNSRQVADSTSSVRAALLAEFRANLDGLVNDSARLADAREAALGLLVLFSPSPRELEADSVRLLINRSFSVSRGFTPTVGVSATLNSEEISSFLGDSIAILLARWQPEVQRIIHEGQTLEDGLAKIVGTWARMGIPISDFAPPYAQVPPSGFAGDFRVMLQDVETESLFAVQAVGFALMTYQYNTASGLAREIIRLLEGDS
jgi:hypothetical protein